MEMRLRTPVTRGYFFLLGASRLVNAASPRTISIDKKNISSGTQGTFLHDYDKKFSNFAFYRGHNNISLSEIGNWKFISRMVRLHMTK